MIRHPWITVVEALSAMVMAALVHLGNSRPRPKPEELHVALSAVGERELPDGSWKGVDLLADPDAPVDRVQLGVRVTAPAQLVVDAVETSGTQRIFPLPGKSGALRPGTTYALPGPRAFYEVQGKVQLRVRVIAVGGGASLEPAIPLHEETVLPVRLSDGAPFEARERAFSAPRGGTVTLDVES